MCFFRFFRGSWLYGGGGKGLGKYSLKVFGVVCTENDFSHSLQTTAMHSFLVYFFSVWQACRSQSGVPSTSQEHECVPNPLAPISQIGFVAAIQGPIQHRKSVRLLLVTSPPPDKVVPTTTKALWYLLYISLCRSISCYADPR